MKKSGILRRAGILFALIILLINSAIAQTGAIKGTVKDKQSLEALIGAAVRLEGFSLGAATDLEGNFNLQRIPPGTYTVLISYVGYQDEKLSNIMINDNTVLELDIKLSSAARELKGAVISAGRITNTENAVLAETRTSLQIVNGVSSQQISKTQDRSATDVMRRIPGITIVDDRFVVIRGLNERYNTVLLNNTFAPSVEHDKKVFSFDLLPSSLIDRVLVYKTGSPELPGEFVGGLIKIYTKSIPDENITQAGYSLSYRSGTTFKDYYEANNEKLDWLGIDGGERGLPGMFPGSLKNVNGDELAQYGKMLPNTWLAKRQNAAPDSRFNFLVARAFKIGKVKAGNITSVTYSKLIETEITTLSNYNDFIDDIQKSEKIYTYEDNNGYQKINIGVISNFSFLLNPKNKVEFQNFYNQSGSNRALVREGANYESGGYYRSFATRYYQRNLYSGQLSGEHDLGNNNRTKISWTTGYNYGNAEEPDYRRVQTNRPLDQPDGKYSLIIGSSASLNQAGRFYSSLTENAVSGSVNFEHKTVFKKSTFEPIIKLGGNFEKKDRAFDARWMSYVKANIDKFNYALLSAPLNEALAPENINPVTGFKLEEGTNPYDSYTNSGQLISYYAGLVLPVTKRINISGGARIENNVIQQNTFDEVSNPLDNRIATVFLLPSVNVSYNLTEKSLIRGAYFKTLNRPEFREIEFYSYFDFLRNEVLNGNPELKTAEIRNADIRWEYYPSPGELITLGTFYKDFKNPIERYISLGSTSGGTRTFKFDNATGAQSLGAEVELRKSLEPVFKTGMLSKITVSMNAAYIYSNVNLGEKSQSQESSRPMLGQSPFMFNSGLYYIDTEQQWQINVLYNVSGRRIFAVGGDKTLPDIYEMPRNLLDASVTKGIGKHFEIKVGVKDILNNSYRFMQDANDDGVFDTNTDQTIESSKPGSYYTVGITFKY